MAEYWWIGATVAWLCLWFGGLRGYLKERLLRRQLEADALTNRTTATYLYPLMGPDHLFNTLRSYEQSVALNERVQGLGSTAPAVTPVVAAPQVVRQVPEGGGGRIAPEVWAGAGWAAPPEPGARMTAVPDVVVPEDKPLPQVVQVVFNEAPQATIPDEPLDVQDGPHFEPGEPTTLGAYGSQQDIVQFLQASIAALEPEEAATKPMAMLGPAGLGKTSLMRAFGNTLRMRNAAHGYTRTPYVEVFPADLANREDLERVLRAAQTQPTVLQIDEVHTLDQEHAVLLYTLLTEGRYQFARAKHAVLFPHLTVVAATTDWAQCHPALRRRFQQLQLSPVTKEDIERAVLGRPFPIASEALESLVSRTHFAGVLFEALRYYDQGVTFAKAEGASGISMGHMEQVYRFNQLDAYGLTAPDRRIIQVLLGMPRHRRGLRGAPDELVCYGGPEAQVAQVAGLDVGSYRLIHKPRLMHRQLLTTRAGYGQVLTERAVQMYGGLAC
jgi:Holliday junction resolvasome RuvABC ATP-dependent DNA helicase subunit